MTLVPTGSVENEQHVVVGLQVAAELVELNLQGLCVGHRHDPGVALSAGRAHRCKQVEPFVLDLARCARASAALGPDAAVAALLAKACLVLEPHLQRALRVLCLHLGEFFAEQIF